MARILFISLAVVVLSLGVVFALAPKALAITIGGEPCENEEEGISFGCPSPTPTTPNLTLEQGSSGSGGTKGTPKTTVTPAVLGTSAAAPVVKTLPAAGANSGIFWPIVLFGGVTVLSAVILRKTLAK